MSSQTIVVNKEKAKQEVKKLIEKYDKIIQKGQDVKSKREEMTKKDLILPLFRALGWDIEDSNEVTAEEKVSKGWVDYGFRINSIPKFFLEAKSIEEDLYDPKFVKQAINYAWLKGCTWAVLTNFGTVLIFNAEWKTTNLFQSRFRTFLCHEFLDRFDELWLLSKQSFEQNLIDKEAERLGKKAERIDIDKQLLADFTRFREILSKSITKNNQTKNLTEEELDESIQRILDRLIFIRNCEDRELEPKTLISNYRVWESRGRGQLIKSLRDIFTKYRKDYNSEIFGETPVDTHLCDDLEIDNEVLHEIIDGLYYTKDGLVYDFSVIPADVLGNIYEQYLSHILKKTAKRATLTEEYVHRKEQGIYYTPTYIVDYIVRNTLGELLKDKKVDVEKIRVLDPACGSGSFLIKAFDVLNEYYRKNEKAYSQTQLDMTGTGITYSKKLGILASNVFGVDLDKQAVEIAKLNLLLKIAEKGHRLPLLDQNIKCGNSLIDDESIAGDKAFKWEENFENVIADSGFDVIIGNPPYINAIQLSKTVGGGVKEYWKRKYYSAKGAFDIFVLFFEQSLNICRESGFVSFITPNKYLSSPYGVALRELISRNYKVIKILDLSKVKVFNDPMVYPIITILQKIKSNKEYKISIERIFSENVNDKKIFEVSSRNLTLLPDYNWGIILSENVGIIERIFDKCKPLEQIAVVQATSTASEADEYSQYISESDIGLPIINTGTIDRYRTTYGTTKFMHMGKRLAKPFLDISKVSEQRRELYTNPKIIISKLALRIEGFLDDEGKYASVNTNCIHSPQKDFQLKYLAGVVNSKLMSFIYSEFFSSLRMSGGYFQFQAPQLRILPIVRTSDDNQNKMSALIEKIMSLNESLNKLGDKRTDERIRIEDEIRKTDAKIDELVYEIYGITEDEKRTIEESLK